MRFEIVIPTYKRLEKLNRMLQSIIDTGNDRLGDVRVMVWFDNGDWETYRMIVDRRDESELEIDYIINPEKNNCFKIWNYSAKHWFNSDVYLPLPDDMEFINGGLKQAMEFYESNYPDTDFVVGLQQDLITRWGGNRGAAPMIGKKFMDRFPDRQCHCPLYNCWCADDELGRFAQKIGKFYYLGNPPLIRHYTNEHNDETNIINQKLRQDDLQLREERKTKGLLWGEK